MSGDVISISPPLNSISPFADVYEQAILLKTLTTGCPPHGGIAFGLDRLAMLMVGAESIRDVIAFPKTQSALCLLTEAPGSVTDESLDELNISRKED